MSEHDRDDELSVEELDAAAGGQAATVDPVQETNTNCVYACGNTNCAGGCGVKTP